jgi:phthalate 4,5-cis-dihydrodiol dehydrogenase
MPRPLKLGMIGIGVGCAEILRAISEMNTIDVVAGADVNPETLRRFANRYPQARTYVSAAALCDDPNVDAVWIASPNRFHAEHAIIAARRGKHIVVEKPMALSIQEAEAMVEAAEKHSVKLLAGHTRAFTLPIRAMRRIIQSQRYGELRALNIWSYSDWMLRPRTADELDPRQGGGVPYRQGPHQIDTIRLLGGGRLHSCRAQTGAWMRERPVAGYYSAFLEFESGLPATIVHNGYGYFVGSELVPWGEDKAVYTSAQRAEIRRALRAGARDEDSEKQSIRIGGEREKSYFDEGASAPWTPEDMGLAIASLDRADLRQSPFGIYVHSDAGKQDVKLIGENEGGMVQRRAELEELYNAIFNGAPLWHDGTWGLATLEVCLALVESARTRQEVRLTRQVSMPASYDADLELAF